VPRRRAVDPASGGFLLDGWPAPHGTHLCGLSASEQSRLAQAAGFVAEALRVGSVCVLVAPSKAGRGIMAELARRAPGLGRRVKAGRLIRSDYARSGAAQLEYFEATLGKATRDGAESCAVLGDLSGGGPGGRNSFDRILEYEAEYERRIARQFPLVTLCQYDASRLSGRELLATLEVHPDLFRPPARTLLASRG
jgi:hypothetical protein